MNLLLFRLIHASESKYSVFLAHADFTDAVSTHVELQNITEIFPSGEFLDLSMNRYLAHADYLAIMQRVKDSAKEKIPCEFNHENLAHAGFPLSYLNHAQGKDLEIVMNLSTRTICNTLQFV